MKQADITQSELLMLVCLFGLAAATLWNIAGRRAEDERARDHERERARIGR